jgi:5-methylcytosine-specific restriction endonuclease McrA
MRHLPTPTDENEQPLDAGDVFEICVSMVQNRTLRTQLRAIRQNVVTEAADYDTKAARRQLYLKQPHNQFGGISGDELVKIYTLRMVPKTSKGRHIYDRIMSAPKLRRCPLCGIGTVNTLDHYLPKTRFPAFSVTPNNLIPACEWCQGEKMEYYPTTKGGQLLHPYFDNIDNDVWLAAEVVIGVPAGFRYFASPPGHWTQSAKARVTAHLKELNLPVLFSSNAGSRLSEIRARLASLHQRGGIGAVRAHLLEDLASIEAEHRNSWTSAMYRAAIASHWFCSGGFLET